MTGTVFHHTTQLQDLDALRCSETVAAKATEPVGVEV